VASAGAKPPGGKLTLAGFHFPKGFLFLTEAGSKRRASLHLVEGERALKQFDRRPRGAGFDALLVHCATAKENHTLKRALTDPRLFSGIGNAYSDEFFIGRASPRWR